MHAWEAIEGSLDYIEEHLVEEITTEELAEAANLSLFYYQRLFKRLIKKSVGEYIKLRRLARALEDLKHPEQRILDAAVNYGFSSHANFTRAFKETYGITPEDYRRDRPMLNTFEKPALSMNYVLIDEGVPLIVGSIVLEIQRKTLLHPEMYVGFQTEVSISGQTPAGETTGIDVPGQLWKRYHEEKELFFESRNSEVEMGMSHSANPIKGTFTYFAGGLASGMEGVMPPGGVKQELPAGDYIVCRMEARRFEELVTVVLDQAGKYLFQTWLPYHKLITEPFSAEKYYPRDGDIYYMEIWVAPTSTEN